MRTAIDSSVLLAILKRERGHLDWQNALGKAAREGILIICPVTFSEISARFPSSESLLIRLDRLAIQYHPIGPKSAWLAGRTFNAYRAEGGPREHMIPDFIIAAHAKIEADCFAAIDRGYLRRYFPDLLLLHTDH